MKSKFERKSEKIIAKKRELTRQIMKDVCDRKSKLNNKKLDAKLLSYAKQMISLEKKKYGINKNITVEKVNIDRIRGRLKYHKGPGIYKVNGKPKFQMGTVLNLNLNFVKNGLRSDDKQDRLNTFVSYIQTIHHEMTHLEQHVATEKAEKIEDINSEEALKYAREFVAISNYGKEYYHKGENYRKQYIERNAREKGYNDAIDVLGKYAQKPQVKEAMLQNMDNNLNDAFVDTEYLQFQDVYGDREYITSTLVDEKIKQNPRLLKKMPILNKEYNKDGSRKEIYQIIKENTKALRRAKINPFYSPAKRKEKMQEIQNMYSSIFINASDASEQKDFEKAEKIVGTKALRAMHSETKKYCENKARILQKNASKEAELRTFLGEYPSQVQYTYNSRISSIEQKFKTQIDELSEKEKFFDEGGFKLKSFNPIEKAKQIKKDELKIHNNFKAKGRIRNVAVPTAVAEINEEVTNLDEVKALRDEYNELRENEQLKLNTYKDEYEYLLAKKEIESNEKQEKSVTKEDKTI